MAATVSRIAARAGVTVPTLYLAWENKRALLRAYLEGSLAPGQASPREYFPDQALGPARPDAVDTAWAIASPDVYDLLVNRAGYSLDHFERWLAATLRAALAKPGHP